MKLAMRHLINMFTTERHCLVLDRWTGFDVLCIVGERARRLKVKGSEEPDAMWEIEMDITEREWAFVQRKLADKGYILRISDEPERINVTKKVES